MNAVNMTRATLDYRDSRPAPLPTAAGFDPDMPEPGFYRLRLRKGAMFSAVRIWSGPPIDPATGEEVPERGVRLQASINAEPVPLERVWPQCAKNPITEAEHDHILRTQDWGRTHAPDSPQADPRRPVDLLTAPLPF